MEDDKRGCKKKERCDAAEIRQKATPFLERRHHRTRSGWRGWSTIEGTNPTPRWTPWARVAGIRRGGGDDTDNDVTGQPRPGPALDPCSSTPKAGRISEHHGPQRGTAPTRTARPDQ